MLYVHWLTKTWIYLTERIFKKRPFMYNKIFLKKTLINVGSSRLWLFDTFCVQIGHFFEAQWDFKLSEEFEIDVIFLRKQRFYRFQTFFKDSQCRDELTNVDAKGAKRSVNVWATNFYNSSFRNILWYMNAMFGCQKFVQYIPYSLG